MTTEQLKAMSIADVLKTDEWKNNVNRIIRQTERSRMQAANEARKADTRLKRHPIDYLIENDMLTVEKITALYTEILERRCDLPSAQRSVVMVIGMEAYRNTMKELTKDNPELLKK